jgi:phosphocarrier protein
MSGAALSRKVTITNELGLHARPAARFVELAGQFDAEITVTHKDETVPGTSILGLLMFGAGPGSELEIAATGAGAEAALDALQALVSGGLGDKPGPDG